MIENILKDFENAYNFSFILLRYFNAAGADIDGEIGENHKMETHLIPLAIKAALEKNTLNIYGNDYPTGEATALGQVSYGELKSGTMKFNGQEIPCVPLSSYVRAREIALILKEWIEKGEFLLTEPQAMVPSA